MPSHLGDLTAGALLADRYRLEQPLGRGATAHVWRARDVELGRVVAVKLLGDDVDEELRARFGREGSILGRLTHPNLVRVHGTGTAGGRPFLVMDFVDGVAFDEVLRRGPVPWDDAAATIADVAAGLAEAHRGGVLHRDVKPANVVCGRDGVPRLVDFGIARAPDVTTMTRADVVLGTASYLAPEQAQAAPLDPAADVYSLGCVLFEAICGRPPFVGDGPLAVALQHINEEPPALSSLTDAEVPAGLDAVIARCLAKRPADRYPTAAELEADLRRVVAGEAPLLGAAADGAGSDADPEATAAMAAVGATAATRAAPAPDSGTMVLPAVGVTDDGEVLDPSPLAEPAPSARPAAAALSVPAPWRNLAVLVTAVLLLALVATAAFGSGGTVDGEVPVEVQPAATTPSEPPPTAPEEPAPPPPGDDGGDDDRGGNPGRDRGKGKKADKDDD